LNLYDCCSAYSLLCSQVRLAIDRETDRPKGFAHIEFTTRQAAERAVKELNGMEVLGREMRGMLQGVAAGTEPQCLVGATALVGAAVEGRTDLVMKVGVETETAGTMGRGNWRGKCAFYRASRGIRLNKKSE